MRLKMFLGREPCNENFLSGSAIASDGKNIEYSRRLAENFRLRNVGACLPFRKFYFPYTRSFLHVTVFFISATVLLNFFIN